MSYIKLKSAGVECNHPSVNKIWMLGSSDDDGKLLIAFNIEMKDGSRKYFENYKMDALINKADEYLQSLPQQNQTT